MRTKSFTGMTCSIAGALEAVSDRWGFLILRDMLLGLTRYDAFQTSSGIPAQTLANRLKHLETYGLIERSRYQDKPPRDEYLLTEKGRDLAAVITALREWGDRWDAHGSPEGAPVVLTNSRTGNEVRLALVDTQTGAVVPMDAAKPIEGPGADPLTRFRLGSAPPAKDS